MNEARAGLVRSIFYNYLARILPFPAVLFINIGLARLFGAAVVGQVSLLLLITTFFSYASRLTTGVGLVHTLAAFPSESRSTWRFVVRVAAQSLPIIVVAAVGVGVVGSLVLDVVYDQRQLWPALWMLIIVFAVFEHGWALGQSCFRAMQKMHLFFGAETIAQYLTLAFLMLLPFWAERTAFNAALYRAFFAVAAFSCGLWFMIREYRRSSSDHVTDGATDKADRGRVIRYGWRALPRELAQMLVRNGDRILIPFFLPISYLGYYASAFAVFQTLVTVSKLPSEMLFVSLSRMNHAKDDQEFFATYRLTQRYIILFGWPCVLLAMGFAETIMGLFGPDFRSAAPALQILLMAALIHSIGELAQNVLMAKDRPQLASLAVTSGAVANVVLNIAFIPLWGLEGAALASCSGYGVTAILALWMSARTSSVSWTTLLETKTILKVLAAGVPLVGLLVFSMSLQHLEEQAFWLAAAFATFAGLAYLTRAWTRQDFASVLRIKQALVARGEKS